MASRKTYVLRISTHLTMQQLMERILNAGSVEQEYAEKTVIEAINLKRRRPCVPKIVEGETHD